MRRSTQIQSLLNNKATAVYACCDLVIPGFRLDARRHATPPRAKLLMDSILVGFVLEPFDVEYLGSL